MSNLAVLNNIDHRDLQVATTRAAEFGDNYMCVPTFPREFRAIQAHYPIVFGKNSSTGEITPLALLGLQNGENLFLRDGAWDARYMPLCAEAKPFLIGPGQGDSASGEAGWAIHVDLDSPRLSREQGTPLFLEFGGNSPLLERIREVLEAIHEGVGEVKPFTDLLTEFELLEPFAAEMPLRDAQRHRLDGFYTVDEERLAALSPEQLARLHNSGFLFDIHMQLGSLSHLADLFERKNARL